MSLGELILNIIFIPLYFLWRIGVFIWELLIDVGKGVRKQTVKFLSFIIFLGIVSYVLSLIKIS